MGDVIFVMLGTNDAAPTAQGYWPDTNHEHCDEATLATLGTCNYANDYRALLEVIASVGPDASTKPEVHIMIPPELTKNGAYHMNQTIINTVFPRLVPIIAEANKDIVDNVIDAYTGMGGIPAPAWETQMPKECNLNSSWAPCGWFCDKQSCDQCHPNDIGCTHLAQVVYDGWKKPSVAVYI